MNRVRMVKHPHRLVGAALALGLTLSACAGDDRITGETASSDVATISEQTVSSAPLDFGAMIAPVPIEVTGSRAEGAGETAAINDGIVAMPDTKLVFNFADNLVLPTANVGYLYRSNQPVDQAALQVVADAFGVDPASAINWDDRAEQFDDTGTTSPDQALPEVSLGYSASDSYQTWTYTDSKIMGDLSTTGDFADCEPSQFDSPATAEPTQSVLPSGQGEVTATTVPGPTIPPSADNECGSNGTPPEGVPTEQEARQLGTDLLTRLGIDVSHLIIEVFASEYSASMAATEKSGEGVATGRSWTIDYGAGAAVSFAQGPLAKPQPVGEYPLVDMAVAQERLRAPRSEMIPVDGGLTGGGETMESLPAAGSSNPPVSESVPASTERVVNIVEVHPESVFLWDNEDNTWGVPAYRFVDSDGNPWIVPAIPDDLMPEADDPGGDLPPTSGPELVPATTMPVGIAPDATTVPGDVESVIDMSSMEPLVGTATVAEFESAAQEIGAEVRVVKIGDEDLIVTEDYLATRINIGVDGSSPDDVSQAIVTSIESVG